MLLHFTCFQMQTEQSQQVDMSEMSKYLIIDTKQKQTKINWMPVIVFDMEFIEIFNDDNKTRSVRKYFGQHWCQTKATGWTFMCDF